MRGMSRCRHARGSTRVRCNAAHAIVAAVSVACGSAAFDPASAAEAEELWRNSFDAAPAAPEAPLRIPLLPRSDAFAHDLRADFYIFDNDVVLFPISFSVPKELVQSKIPKKTAFAVNDSTRSFTIKRYQFGPLEEEGYHRNIQKHRFGDTRRKGGHDCLRHYELLANGCVPILHDLEHLPRSILTTLPRPLLSEAKRLFALPWRDTDEGPGSLDEDVAPPLAYERLLGEMLNYTARRLTTEASARYLLDTMGIDLGGFGKPKPKVLFLSCVGIDNFPSFLAASMFHGLVSLLGDNVVDVPEYDYAYAFNPDELRHDSDVELRFRQDLWGQGYTLGFKLRRRPHLNRTRIAERIRAQEFDLIVFARMSAYEPCNFWYSYKGHPNMVPQFFEDVYGLYPIDRVALLYGDDSGLDDAMIRTNARRMGSLGRGLGYVFMRELLPFVGEGPPTEVLRPVDERLLQPGCFTPEWLDFFARWWGRRGQSGLLGCVSRGDCDESYLDEFRASGSFALQEPNMDPPALRHFCRNGYLLRAALLVQSAGGQDRCAADPACLKSCTFCLGTYARGLSNDLPSDAFFAEFGVTPSEVLYLLSLGCAGGAVALQPAAALGPPERRTFAIVAEGSLTGQRGPYASAWQVVFLLRQGFSVLLVGADTAETIQGPLAAYLRLGRLQFAGPPPALDGGVGRCAWAEGVAEQALLGLHVEDVAGGAPALAHECLQSLSRDGRNAPTFLSLQLQWTPPGLGESGLRDTLNALGAAGYRRFKVSLLSSQSLGGPVGDLAAGNALGGEAWLSVRELLQPPAMAEALIPGAQLHATF